MRVTVSLSDRDKRWDWRDDAQCREIGTDLFYPNDGDRWTALMAKGLCVRCPVRHECLEFALETCEPEGIWGGMSPRERMAMRRAKVTAS